MAPLLANYSRKILNLRRRGLRRERMITSSSSNASAVPQPPLPNTAMLISLAAFLFMQYEFGLRPVQDSLDVPAVLPHHQAAGNGTQHEKQWIMVH